MLNQINWLINGALFAMGILLIQSMRTVTQWAHQRIKRRLRKPYRHARRQPKNPQRIKRLLPMKSHQEGT